MGRSVLVTGASGLLGRDVIVAFKREGWKTTGTGLTRANPPEIIKLDLLSHDSLVEVLEQTKPDVVVHCAANRFPDSVEANPQAATALNVESTRDITAECQKRGILLIYISTDYVFPGKPGEAPYKVTDKPSPPNAYGKTKHEGEVALLGEAGKSKNKAVVLRVPLLYGHCEENDKSKSAVHPLLDAIRKGEKLGANEAKIKVDDYALRYPTWTGDVGSVLVNIANKYLDSSEQELPQILHFSGQAKFTKWEITKLLAEILSSPTKNLEAHDPSKEESEGATQRPYDSHLDVSTLDELGITWGNTDFESWWRRDLRVFRH